jgi:predicted permease
MNKPRRPNGCWNGGCLGGLLGGVALPILWFSDMVRDGIDFDIIASFALLFYIAVGVASGILLGGVIGAIIQLLRRDC